MSLRSWCQGRGADRGKSEEVCIHPSVAGVTGGGGCRGCGSHPPC